MIFSRFRTAEIRESAEPEAVNGATDLLFVINKAALDRSYDVPLE